MSLYNSMMKNSKERKTKYGFSDSDKESKKGTKPTSPFRGKRGASKDKPTVIAQREAPSVASIYDAYDEDELDRPLAYPVGEVDMDGMVVEWEPPTVREILKDLGLRMLEVGIAAAAQEVAYFFHKRRFIPRSRR